MAATNIAKDAGIVTFIRAASSVVKLEQTVYLCFSTDFLVEDADEWRCECWQMIRERSDLHFLF